MLCAESVYKFRASQKLIGSVYGSNVGGTAGFSSVRGFCVVSKMLPRVSWEICHMGLRARPAGLGVVSTTRHLFTRASKLRRCLLYRLLIAFATLKGSIRDEGFVQWLLLKFKMPIENGLQLVTQFVKVWSAVFVCIYGAIERFSPPQGRSTGSSQLELNFTYLWSNTGCEIRVRKKPNKSPA